MSFKFLEYKLSLLIFPLLFFLHGYDEKQRNAILKAMVWGLAASAAVCLIVAFYKAIQLQEGEFVFQPNVLEGRAFMESILYGGNYFFGKYVSIFHQTVYYAMYLCTGLTVLLFRRQLFSVKLRTALLAALLVMIFLVSNRASFIVLGLVFALKLWKWQVKPVKKAIGILLFAVMLVLLTFLNPRAKDTLLNIAEGKMKLNKEARYGFGTRLLSWDAAISLIKERPVLGYGHAATQNVLNKRYEEKAYIFPLKESYNAHNLWLQSWLENGLIAVLLLLTIFWLLFRKSYGSSLLMSFTLIILVNSMFEGMFNRFSGISFVSFMVSFIFATSQKGGGLKT
jgi:O-antigen ligase